MLRKSLRYLAIGTGTLLSLALIAAICAWLKFRIPTGPTITSTAIVKYQMIDLGQDESDSRSVIELLTMHQRIFLTAGPFPFIYATADQAKACWPESPFDMAKKGYTVQVTFRIRKLKFSEGYSPVSYIQAQQVPGSPTISK